MKHISLDIKLRERRFSFFIRADGGVSFSGLVDCYRSKDIDIVSSILRESGVNKLNFICWTHPDLDHSKGLKEMIKQYSSSETNIWIPEGVDAKEISCSEEVKNLFAYLKQCARSMETELNVYSVSDKKDLTYYDSLCFQKGIDAFPLNLISYTPNSKIMRKQNYLDKFIRNDRSIFFVLSLGQVRIWLTGDIEDATIEQIPKEFFAEHIHILKIPHHGSGTSTKIMELGWTDCDVACSTVYRKGRSHLPDEKVMAQYKKLAENLYCTGNEDRHKEKQEYGMVKVVTNVLDNSYTTVVQGNAEIWN